ncbi:MAG: hypothetical protein RLO52_24450 [Sandaracinaceae bacterium]
MHRFFIALTLALATACGGGVRQFALQEPLWQDDDRQPFTPRPPQARYAPYFWDAMDNMIFRRASEAFTFELSQEAIDVNALDEVPDSSWFHNRIGRWGMAPAELARGACGEETGPPPGPWRVVGGKPDGATPGFLIESADGTRYLLKTDRAGQREQATAADAIAAAAYHAAGYHVPCNRVVFFRPDVLELAPDAEVSGSDRPLTEEDVRTVLEGATEGPDGTRRAVLSRFIEGTPLGPWSYTGTWDLDANDVVPHERRRELRGIYVLNAWLDHWDSRQHNTLAAWIEAPGGGGHVRHYLIDFGECMGMVEAPHRRGPRMGHSVWLDFGHVVEDTLGLGIVQRAWDGRERHPVLGYYGVAHFDPDGWTPQYWNGALDRRTARDEAWGARILARFRDPHIRAMVSLGHFSDPEVAERLEGILRSRRDRALERYLMALSPLTEPALRQNDEGRAELCLTDLAVHAGLRTRRLYTARLLHAGATRSLETRRQEEGVCVAFPSIDGEGGSTDYAIVEVDAASPGRDESRRLSLHFYVTGPDRLRLVGLER